MGRTLQGQGGGGGKSKLHEKWKKTNWVVESTEDEIVHQKHQTENLVQSKTKLIK